jgi:tellurite resistance protein TerC
VFAILGLRALFFVLAGMMDKFAYLKPGVAIILIFVGLKMISSHWIHLPTVLSLAVIVVILTTAVLLSLRRSAREASRPA